MVNPITLIIRGKKLGALLKDARLTAGMSLNECATAIGVTSSRIGAFEKGKKPPSLPELEALAFLMDVSLSHFWGDESLFEDKEDQVASLNLHKWVTLRTRIIGALLRNARADSNMTLKELSGTVNITPRKLKSYETGDKPVPLPELEIMLIHMDIPIGEFMDKEGVVGQWIDQKKTIDQFLSLPEEIQKFVTQPVNLPFIEVAQKLSDLPADKLRIMAEGILEITL